MPQGIRKPVPCPTCDGLKDPRAAMCTSCRARTHYADSPNEKPRRCSVCKETKAAESFRLRKVSDRMGGGFRRESLCLDCARTDARNRQRARHASGKPWSNPVYQLRHFARRVCGVDPDALVDLVEHHDGVCEICGRTAEEAEPGKRLAVDHSSAGVRGMLCRACNTALGLFQDSPAALRRAADYLEQEPVLVRVAV